VDRYGVVCTCQDWLFRSSKIQTESDLLIRASGSVGQVVQSERDDWIVSSGTSSAQYVVNVYKRSKDAHAFLCKHIIAVFGAIYAPDRIVIQVDLGLDDEELGRVGDFHIVKVSEDKVYRPTSMARR
jgi:hypothetical protein